MEEYWEVYDKFRRKVGKKIKRNSLQKLKDGEYHIVITGIIQNYNNQILISKRSKNKREFPELWECTNGSVKIGENSIAATIREINEELGIEFEMGEGQYLGTIQEKNYFRDIWMFKRNISDEEIKFNDKEVTDSKWVSIEEYEKLYKSGKIVPTNKFVIQYFKEKEVGEER